MNILAASLSITSFFVLWGVFCKVLSERRSAFLSASILWAIWAVLITEILSLFRALTFAAVLAAWGIIFSLALIGWIRLMGFPKNPWWRFKLPKIPRFEFFVLSAGTFIVFVVGLIAFVAPPNTWDSMTYHLPRVMHWIQDRSVAYYPTFILRQLYLAPGAEYLILQFQILSGSDMLANLVQWFSMIGAAVGVSLIAKRMGTNLRGQVFSSAAVLTIPMGILEASSTQTDYVLAFWLVCFIYCMIDLRDQPELWKALACGASLGLAVLTKATGYVYAFPFLIWLVTLMLRTYRAKGAAFLAAVALVALVINLPNYVRNYDLFSNPLGLRQETGTDAVKFSNDVFSVPELTSNVLRNLALQMATPFDAVNTSLDASIRTLHGAIGISPDDRRTTWAGTKFEILTTSFREESDGNFLHLVFIGLSMGVILFRWRHSRVLAYYSTCVILAFLLFCLYLKWQPWNSRLHLPLFVLCSPVIGIATSGIRRDLAAKSVIVILLLGALPWVFLNQLRPLIGAQNILNVDRTSQYFRYKPELEESYKRTVRYLALHSDAQCRRIGLRMSFDSWEYPLWVLLNRDLGKDVAIQSVNVKNISSQEYANFPGFVPCAILALGRTKAETLTVGGAEYSRARTFDMVSIFMPGRTR